MSYCNCGCNSSKVIAYQKSSSCCNKTYSGTYFCKEPWGVVKSNFVVPAANIEVEVEVIDSSKFYEGQGIQIGNGYFQVVSIVDSTNITIAHNGTAVQNTTIIAVHPSYGCYQYPIYYAGYVGLLNEPELTGVDSDFVEVADSVIDPIAEIVYGYLGPKKVQLAFQATCEIANDPQYVSVPLPVSAGSAVLASFSCSYNLSASPGVYLPGVAFRNGDNLLIGSNDGTPLAADATYTIIVSGEYDIE